MERNIVLAGVGGQGILTIARAISIAALKRGLHVKQSEVHGMAQRGGAVQAHLRYSDRELMSDLIPRGRAELVLALEPLESLRHVAWLREGGVLIASTCAVTNIDNYPPIESVLERIARLPQHILIDAERLARLGGAARSANIVLLGAAADLLELPLPELEQAVADMFASKGPRVVEANLRALRVGRNAAAAYAEALRQGRTPSAARRWLDSLPAGALTAQDGVVGFPPAEGEPGEALSAAEAAACVQILQHAAEQGRRQLLEHEVYKLVELVGAIVPPRYVFVPAGEVLAPEALEGLPGERVVLKLVSPDVIHKSDVRAVRFVPRDAEIVRREIVRLLDEHAAHGRVEGVLAVEFVESAGRGIGQELFVGIRSTREFGPVIAAGLGGVDTEYLAQKLRPDIAVAKAVASEVTAGQYMDLFRRTAAYELLSGRARGHERVVSDGELLRCFGAFLAIARRFCTRDGGPGPYLEELEVNPFAFRRQQIVPLDGRGRLGEPALAPPARPLEKLQRLLEPGSIAVLGVSAREQNLGRIILGNIRRCGFPPEHLYVVKDHPAPIDGVPCVARVRAAPEPIDLLVVAAPAAQLPVLIEDVAASGRVASVILIPGGVGETEDSAALSAQVRDAIAAARRLPGGGPVFVGPNCLGVQSRAGRYDTFFIPDSKLDVRAAGPPRRCALLSQSGAFIITRLSNLQTLNPALSISIGNQADVTVGDFLHTLAGRSDIDVIGVYVEGFRDLDGLATLRAIRRASASDKVVIFYKAGRTESGRCAAAGHTASVAGDYDVCQSAAAQAGAIVTDTFKEFEQLLELATALHDKRVTGRRIAAVSNAGYETVGMADCLRGARYELSMPAVSEPTRRRLVDALCKHGLERLVNPRNPLDLTPMASDAAYEDCLRPLLEADEFDALVVSTVPLTPAMLSTPQELDRPGSLAERIPRLFAAAGKPMVMVIDCGPLYDELALRIRAAGVPVFRSCDQAIRSLGRYLCHRAAGPVAGTEPAAGELPPRAEARSPAVPQAAAHEAAAGAPARRTDRADLPV